MSGKIIIEGRRFWHVENGRRRQIVRDTRGAGSSFDGAITRAATWQERFGK